MIHEGQRVPRTWNHVLPPGSRSSAAGAAARMYGRLAQEKKAESFRSAILISEGMSDGIY